MNYIIAHSQELKDNIRNRYGNGTWGKAKPGDEMYLTMWDYTPIHPRLNEYSGRILILGFILFGIPFVWFMHKGLTE